MRLDSPSTIRVTNSHDSKQFIEFAVNAIAIDYNTESVSITCPGKSRDVVLSTSQVNEFKSLPGFGITGIVLWNHAWDNFVEQML